MGGRNIRKYREGESDHRLKFSHPPFPRRLESDCGICQRVIEMLLRPRSEQSLVLGSFDDVLSRPACDHTRLFAELREICAKSDATKLSSVDVALISGRWLEDQVSLVASLADPDSPSFVLHLDDTWSSNKVAHDLPLDKDWFSEDLLSQWKTKCFRRHGDMCANPLKLPRVSPDWLIDIEQACIVPGLGVDLYIALSYRWGRIPGFKLDSERLAVLRKPGAFDEPNFKAALAPTLRDAIYLTRRLGERYLWIDAFCIVHGDQSSTVDQLNSMSSIYASAALTLVAADGDAADGIRGLEGQSESRQLRTASKLLPMAFGSGYTVKCFKPDPRVSAYHQRGWTYQECMMSSRKMIFAEGTVHWQCHRDHFHERSTSKSEFNQYITPMPKSLLSGFPDLDALSLVIGRYNSRKLSYDEDALPGIMGILSLLSRTFEGGFLYGLPETLFDRALGWMCDGARRRVESDRPQHERLSSAGLPSWSWVGWQGDTFWPPYHDGEAARITNNRGEIEETIPITAWYTSSSPLTSDRRHIRATWFEKRDDWRHSSPSLPQDWTRNYAYESIGLENPMTTDLSYSHKYDHTSNWYYPFTVPEIRESTPQFVPDQTAYLFCQTKRAHLQVREGDQAAGSLSLHDGSNKEIGFISSIARDDLKRILAELASNGDSKTFIEVVAIYRSKVYIDFGLLTRTYPSTFDDAPCVSERYTVLWIKWEDGVAYRHGIGYIGRDIWEALPLEDVDLVLG